MIKIGVDANGGDNGVNTTVPAAMMAIKEFDDIEDREIDGLNKVIDACYGLEIENKGNNINPIYG